ncbi:MAG: hypothetical protein FWH44_01855 [Methanomassiliicoccaceae archaeon]|nr:hypothetical protein [Methanomassiliicoccaceae archaeon]
MPQVSLYFEQALYTELKSTASKKNVSVSSYVSDVLKDHLDKSWPEGFFDTYFGAAKDDPLEEPEEWEYI